MTYCVALKMASRLIFMSDTRTNAGVDNISTFQKMRVFHVPGDRTITVMTAGNLATTQALISLLEERDRAPNERNPGLLEVPSMFQAARLVGDTLREVIAANAPTGQKADATFNATLIVGGQIKGQPPRLFLIYPEGNFIEASADTPFFQIGETKYGRPILVRAFDPAMSAEDAIKLLLVSFDSTVKANLSVGLPFDVHLYDVDSLSAGRRLRFEIGDKYYSEISASWGEALKTAFASLPDFSFES